MHEFLEFTIIGIVLGSAYAVAASGLVVTYATSGIFNIAHGAIGMFMAFVYWQLSVGWHMNAGLAFVLTVFVLAPLMGALIERGVIQWMDPRNVATALAVTVGLTLLIFGLVDSYIWKPTARVVPQFFGFSGFTFLGREDHLGGGHHGRCRHCHRGRASACSSTRRAPAWPCAASSTTGS